MLDVMRTGGISGWLKIAARAEAFNLPVVIAATLREGERVLARADPLMRRLIKLHGPCGLAPHWRRSPYEALVRAIVFQQLNGKAAATILGRFMDLFPGHAFPPPEAVLAHSDEGLKSVGLSRQR